MARVEKCICCDKQVQINIWGTPKAGQELFGHVVVCEDCAKLLGFEKGLKGAFVATTYTQKRALEKYSELTGDTKNLNSYLEAQERIKNAKQELKEKEKNERRAEYQRQSKRIGCTEKKEEKYTCTKCNATWYSDDMDILKNVYNATTSRLTLSQVKDLSQCRNCGSKASTHKTVRYWVDKKGNCVDREE